MSQSFHLQRFAKENLDQSPRIYFITVKSVLSSQAKKHPCVTLFPFYLQKIPPTFCFILNILEDTGQPDFQLSWSESKE